MFWNKRMAIQRYLIVGIFLLLAACGTVKINIDYGNTPIPSIDTPGIPTQTPTPSLTPTYTVTPTATETVSPGPTESLSGVVAVAAGHSHTCAVTEGGTVKCWGANDHGQVGNGTMVNSNVPVEVSGLAGVKAITAGYEHTCALTDLGAVKCWGYNANGELGNGTSVDSDMPVDVTGLSAGVAAIDAGDDHTCAVTINGGLKCWGYNEFGQLGDGTKSSRSVPVDSQGFASGVAEVAAGWGHTCVRTTGGGAKCWGDNEYGQLGDGETVDSRLSPVDVVGLTYGVLKISAEGGQSCALTSGGGVSCWGNNKYAQLGDGSGRQRNVPVQAAGLTAGVSDVEVGWNHACAIISGGELKCWGWNYYGQLGDGTKITQSKPVKVTRLTDGIRDLAVGWAHTCVATDLGAVKCWGLNAFGQLGDGTRSDSGSPLAVVGLGSVPDGTKTIVPTLTPTRAASATLATTAIPTMGNPGLTPTPNAGISSSALTFVSISAGEFHTCGVTSSGGVKCWGSNSYGQLGDGTKTDRNVPVNVVGLSEGVVAVEAGLSHTCALSANGGVLCWGMNGHGQLGDGTTTNSSVPVNVKGLSSGMRAVNAGDFHTCALTSDGVVMCWGGNFIGQLGNGMTTDSSTPVKVEGLSDVVVTSISAGGYHNCALITSGAIKCWGGNKDRQLGDGTTDNHYIPIDVIGLSSGAVALTTSKLNTCAIVQLGGLECWGDFLLGGAVNGGGDIPTKVIGLAGSVVDVSAGYQDTCVLISNGGAQCWGFNDDGQLGDGTTQGSNHPVTVLGLQGTWEAITVGSLHACSLATNGAAMCWGNNDWGQLGDGTNSRRLIPVAVVGM